MFYTATRTIKAWDHRNNVEVTYQAGDVIHDFEEWNQQAQRSNLNIGWVEKQLGNAPKEQTKKEESVAKVKIKRQRKAKKVVVEEEHVAPTP